MAVEIRVPSSGESVVEATVGRWYKQPGETVKADEDVVELETDKVNVTVQTPVAGVLESILRQTGDIVGIDELLATVVPAGAPAVSAALAPVAVETRSPSAASTSANGEAASAPVTPVAAKILDGLGLKPSDVHGSGPNGKVTKEDVQNHVATASVREPVAVAATVAAPVSVPATPKPTTGVALPVAAPVANPLLSDERREIVEPMSRLRKTIAAHLVEGQHTAAMLTTFNEVDMTAVMEIRKRRKDAFKEKYGVNLGFMSFFTKAVIGGLKAFPLLNAEIRNENIVRKQYYDIGIAVGTDRGLVVPVVRNADRLTFAGIEKEIGNLAGKARNNQLSIADMAGGTFTITNGGVYGSLMSTPILNAPQVGILGMHKIQERPIAVDGQVVIRPMMYLALSYDHRIVDGSEAVRFLVRVKELLEDPESMLLEG